MRKATIIQRRFRLYQLKSKTSKKLKELKDEQLRLWNSMQKEFKTQWPHIK